jgi:hypothetical protein
MANFSVNLTGLRDTWITGKALFLHVFSRMFPEVTGFTDWVRNTALSEHRHHPINWEPTQNKKAEEGKFIFSLLELRHPSSPVFGHQNHRFFGHQDLHQQTSSQVSGLWP